MDAHHRHHRHRHQFVAFAHAKYIGTDTIDAIHIHTCIHSNKQIKQNLDKKLYPFPTYTGEAPGLKMSHHMLSLPIYIYPGITPPLSYLSQGGARTPRNCLPDSEAVNGEEVGNFYRPDYWGSALDI